MLTSKEYLTSYWNYFLETIRSIYIHFPFCRHLCNYCDFYKKKKTNGPNDSELKGYYNLLEESFTKLSHYMGENQILIEGIETLYLGGGTPSLGGIEYLKYLKGFLDKNKIQFQRQYEWTIECNPDSVDSFFISNAVSLGVNRFSLGVQSLDSTLFKYLDRVHSLDDSFKALHCLSDNNINYSVDLMLGLPRPEGHIRDIAFEIQEIVNGGASHISLYILKVPGSYKYYDLLPNENEVADEYLLVAKILNDLGFEHYEVSNFAKPGYYSRHNKKYWLHESVLALGPSATGYFASQKFRYKWKPESSNYSWEVISDSQEKLERLFLAIRTNSGIKISEYFHQIEAIEVFRSWAQNGLGILNNDHFVLTSNGYLVEESLINELFSKNLL